MTTLNLGFSFSVCETAWGFDNICSISLLKVKPCGKVRLLLAVSDVVKSATFAAIQEKHYEMQCYFTAKYNKFLLRPIFLKMLHKAHLDSFAKNKPWTLGNYGHTLDTTLNSVWHRIRIWPKQSGLLFINGPVTTQKTNSCLPFCGITPCATIQRDLTF